MPKQISYTLCDCGKGKLGEIASTKIDWPSACGSEGSHREYFECDHCKQIWEARVTHPPFGDNSGSKRGKFYPYQGKLTKDDIVEHAGECYGSIYSWHEKKILQAKYEFSVDPTKDGINIAIKKKITPEQLELITEQVKKVLKGDE